MAGGDELAERAACCPERIEPFHRNSTLRMRPSEIRQLPREFFDNSRFNRFVYPRTHFDIAVIEANLPGIGRRNDDIAANEFAPVHMIAEGCREQANTIAAFAEDLISLLEHCHSGPLQITRIDRDVFSFGHYLQPI